MPRRLLLIGCTIALGCSTPGTGTQPVFVRGRPVAASGDSLFATTTADGLLLLRRPAAGTDTVGRGVLHDPLAVQSAGGAWWVSDVVEGRTSVVRFGAGAPARIELGPDAAQPHQFAVLPDGGIVWEVTDRRLVVRRGDSTVTFAPVERGDRPSLLAGAQGGALHAVPGRHLTLYNAFGNIRWRIEWPWVETAHMAAIAVDPLARVHLLSGVADQGTFIVYTLQASSGEITRWSEPDSNATFVVDRLGAVTAAAGGWWDR